MKKNIVIIFVAFQLFFLGDIIMASPIADSWIYATIRIENEWGGQGTGFLVTRALDPNSGLIFLCTNKHVLHQDKKKRQSATKLICYLNETDKDNKIVGIKQEVPLTLPDGTKRWKEHPDEDVDVMAFNITDLIIKRPNMVKKWASYNLFVDKEILSKQEITIGEEILVLGFPQIFPKYKSNFPIVRQGIIASQIGERYIDEKDNKKRILRGFLIDGGVIPGSSGSPVILKPISGRVVNKRMKIGIVNPPYLLGMITEYRISPLQTKQGNIPSYAGIGFAFDASTIKETIELFFEKEKPKK